MRLSNEIRFIWHPIIAQLGGHVIVKSWLKQVCWRVIRLCEVSSSYLGFYRLAGTLVSGEEQNRSQVGRDYNGLVLSI